MKYPIGSLVASQPARMVAAAQQRLGVCIWLPLSHCCRSNTLLCHSHLISSCVSPAAGSCPHLQSMSIRLISRSMQQWMRKSWHHGNNSSGKHYMADDLFPRTVEHHPAILDCEYLMAATGTPNPAATNSVVATPHLMCLFLICMRQTAVFSAPSTSLTLSKDWHARQ